MQLFLVLYLYSNLKLLFYECIRWSQGSYQRQGGASSRKLYFHETKCTDLQKVCISCLWRPLGNSFLIWSDTIINETTLHFRQPSGKKIIVAKPSPTAVKSASEKTQRSAKLRSKQPKDLDKCSASRNTSSSKRVPPVTKQEVAIPGRQSVLMVTIKDKSIQVHLPSEGAPRSPTLSECKAIIKHQQDANQQQAQEVFCILKFFIFSRKLWQPHYSSLFELKMEIRLKLKYPTLVLCSFQNLKQIWRM